MLLLDERRVVEHALRAVVVDPLLAVVGLRRRLLVELLLLRLRDGVARRRGKLLLLRLSGRIGSRRRRRRVDLVGAVSRLGHALRDQMHRVLHGFVRTLDDGRALCQQRICGDESGEVQGSHCPPSVLN